MTDHRAGDRDSHPGGRESGQQTELTMTELPRDIAAAWASRAGRLFVVCAVLSIGGFASAVLLPSGDTVPLIIVRSLSLSFAYLGGVLAWATGSLAVALFLYSRA